MRRTDARSPRACVDTQQPGDYAATGPDEPGYFLWLDGRFIAIDLGTSTARQLRIMNLATRKSVWTDDVTSDPDGAPPTEKAYTFWKVGSQIPFKSCPASWRKAQRTDLPAATAHRIAEMRFDVATGRIRTTGRTACSFQETDVSLPTVTPASPKSRS